MEMTPSVCRSTLPKQRPPQHITAHPVSKTKTSGDFYLLSSFPELIKGFPGNKTHSFFPFYFIFKPVQNSIYSLLLKKGLILQPSISFSFFYFCGLMKNDVLLIVTSFTCWKYILQIINTNDTMLHNNTANVSKGRSLQVQLNKTYLFNGWTSCNKCVNCPESEQKFCRTILTGKYYTSGLQQMWESVTKLDITTHIQQSVST